MRNKVLQVGVTGGIGVGKSTVCSIFKGLNIPVYDADSRAKWLMNHDKTIRQGLIELFGEQSYKGEVLNRHFVASQIFGNENHAKSLEAVVHPAVGKDYDTWVSSNKHHKYVLKEAALLFESGAYKALDKIIVVSAPVSIRVERVLKRDKHRSRSELEAIMNKQMPDSKKEQRADYIVINDGKQLLTPQVLRLHRSFCALARA